jgi:putative drug exporter of the RND superfamily
VFRRLGDWCYRRRKTVVLLWVVALVVFGGIYGAVGSNTRDEFTLPNVESKTGFDILEDHFGGEGDQSGTIVFKAEQGVTDPEVQAEMESFLAEVDEIDRVALLSPYDEANQGQISQDGTVAFASVQLPSDITLEQAVLIRQDVDEVMPEIDGVQIEIGGAIFADFEVPSSEALGLGFAIVILLLAFGSVLAMGLPVGVALAGISAGSILGGLLSHVLVTPSFANIIGVMIGLGVGIDYALFIVTRFRENLHHGHGVEASTVIAMDTAGRAVTFAGITVVISLMGMLIMQLPFVSGLAVGAAVVVFMTLIASLTLLPALLGFVGERVEITRWRGLIGAGFIALGLVGAGAGFPILTAVGFGGALLVLLVSFAFKPLRRLVPRREPKPLPETTAYRWSRLIQHHPWLAVLVGVVVLGALALPVLGLRLGFSDEGNYPEDTTTRQAYDLLAEGFGPGFNGPMLVITELPDGTDQAALDEIGSAIEADDGVAFVSPPIPNDPDNPTAVMWRVIPTTAPQDVETGHLVSRLREDVLPPAEEGTGLEASVTGSVAINVDFSEYLTERLPWFFAAVLGLSFLLLMVVFRSLLVPLKAVVMNLLSIGAAYGVVVMVFQWGWGGSLLNIDGAPIEPFVPMMLFAILFGLSMDYEVFLLSRVKEEWDRTGDSHLSVADGLAATARVITAAAAIMVFVFGSFIFESDRIVKLFGVGLAMAVLIDATIVRLLLVPATMELLGDRNWWLPRWLDRILPRINVEASSDVEAEVERELEPVG